MTLPSEISDNESPIISPDTPSHSPTILSKIALIFVFAKLSTLFPNKEHFFAIRNHSAMADYPLLRTKKKDASSASLID